MRTYLVLLVASGLIGCAGIPVPFTDYRILDFPVAIGKHQVNSTCTNLETLRSLATELERRHVSYLRSGVAEDALDVDMFINALGDACLDRYTQLDTGEIKHELFGDLQIVGSAANKLIELGGYSFEYQDTLAIGGVALTLHLDKSSKGPKRRMVAIYNRADGKVLHFSYTGRDDMDTKSRTWPLDEFFGIAVGAAGKAVLP